MPKKTDPPDIEIGAALKAKKLRFDHVPKSSSREVGDWSSVTERTNLPQDLEQGVTYRNVEVRWDVQARFEQQQVEDQARKPRGRKGP